MEVKTFYDWLLSEDKRIIEELNISAKELVVYIILDKEEAFNSVLSWKLGAFLEVEEMDREHQIKYLDDRVKTYRKQYANFLSNRNIESRKKKSLEILILNLLKEKLLSIKKDAEFDTKMQSALAPYYLANLKDNLITPMNKQHFYEYNKGDGNELKEKMRAIRSSSAMTFNLLGNNFIEVKSNPLIPSGIYFIEYEKGLRTIKRGGRHANLDAKLNCQKEESVVFCEMKMLEWLTSSPGTLRNTYLKKDKYCNPNSFDAFNEVFLSLIEDYSVANGNHKSIYERYDVFQMMKHILGIYNAIYLNKENEYESIKKARLINCVWQVHNLKSFDKKAKTTYINMQKQHYNEYLNFKNKLKPIIDIFKQDNIDFDIEFMYFDEFLNIIKKTENELEYLQRYFI